jgi:adenosylhomocysteine nucleosidase
MIGIIGAMKMEVESLCHALTDQTQETVSGITFVRGRLYGKELVVAQSGVGKVFAAICAQTMILRYAPQALINTGVSGSLSPLLGVNDIAVSTACVQHDMDTSPLGDPVGMISGINVVELRSDAPLSERLCQAIDSLGYRRECGVIVSGDRFISSTSQKKTLREQFGGIACDMESAAIAHVCYVNQVPFVALRAISDCADGSADVSFAEFAAIAAERSLQVLHRTLQDS